MHLKDLWLAMPSTIEKVLVVVEDAKSYIGRELTLDFTGVKSVSAHSAQMNSVFY